LQDPTGLSGIILDRITRISPSLPLTPPTAYIRGHFSVNKVFSSWKLISGVLSYKTYIKGTSMQAAYWQTLLAGHLDWGNGPATEANYLEWENLWHNYDYLFCLPLPLFNLALYIATTIAITLRLVRVILAIVTRRAIEQEPTCFRKALNAAIDRRFIRTSEGYISIPPREAREGDRVAVVQGGKMLLVICEEGTRWQLVGDWYLHGIMQGEAFNADKCDTIWFS
jgi:hypothetical protein